MYANYFERSQQIVFVTLFYHQVCAAQPKYLKSASDRCWLLSLSKHADMIMGTPGHVASSWSRASDRANRLHYIAGRYTRAQMQQGKRIAHPPARTCVRGKQTLPLRKFTVHAFSSVGLLFCLPPLLLRQIGRGAVRATVSEEVSGYCFFYLLPCLEFFINTSPC